MYTQVIVRFHPTSFQGKINVVGCVHLLNSRSSTEFLNVIKKNLFTLGVPSNKEHILLLTEKYQATSLILFLLLYGLVITQHSYTAAYRALCLTIKRCDNRQLMCHQDCLYFLCYSHACQSSTVTMYHYYLHVWVVFISLLKAPYQAYSKSMGVK